MNNKFLRRMKKSVVRNAEDDGMGGSIQDDGVDLESGTIIIDDGPEFDSVTTGEVLRQGHDHETDAFFKGFTGTVFVLDISPLFAAIGTDKNSRIGQSLMDFAENLLSRMLRGIGIFKTRNSEQFFSGLTRMMRKAGSWRRKSSMKSVSISCAINSNPMRCSKTSCHRSMHRT
ncbi:MAG: hypothetical protein CMM10_10235 [Rhodospirillaceae bacterium]|nr:hypothetical protein [Rhodospirillaceae bacterium]